MFSEVVLTPTQRGFKVGNFGRDLKISEFLAILAILRISTIWAYPLYAGHTYRTGENEPSHLGAPYSRGRCKSKTGRGFLTLRRRGIDGISQIRILISGVPIFLRFLLGRFLGKFRFWVPKIDFSHIGQMSPGN